MAMPVTCGACSARFQIDENKLPAGKVRIKCPKCAKPVEVEKPVAAAPPPGPTPAPAAIAQPEDDPLGGAFDAPEPAPATAPAPVTPSAQAPAAAAAPVSTAQVAPATAIGASAMDPDARRLLLTLNEILKRGIRPDALGLGGGLDDGDEDRALVCEDEEMFSTILRDQLVALGYRVDVAPTVADALRLIKDKRYEVVTVDNRFPDNNEGGYEILRALSFGGTALRRKIYAVFISADLKTMDAGSAFFHGANLSINKKDVKRAGGFIRDGIEEYRRFYRVFDRVQAELLEDK